MLLGLDITISPLRQHLRLACQIAISMDNSIHGIAAHEIIIDLIHCIQKQVRLPFLIIKSHQRTAVKQHSISFCRNKQRHWNPHIVLVKILIVSAIIVNSFLRLAKTVNLFLLFPVEKYPCTITVAHLLRLQILNKVTLTVNCFYTVDNRLLTSSCIAYYVNFC